MEQLFADKVRIGAEEFWPEIPGATAGFSGADLKRLVQDAKLQMAVDMIGNRNREAFNHHQPRLIEDAYDAAGPVQTTFGVIFCGILCRGTDSQILRTTLNLPPAIVIGIRSDVKTT